MTVELERLPTGIPGLDAVLEGGLLKGGVYILQGSPGAGKTILANQMCFRHVADGGRAAFVTLLAESHTRMLQHLKPLSFFDQSVIPDSLYYVSGFDALESEGLKGLVGLIQREIRGHGATMLILDGFLATKESAPGEREFKKFIHELQSHAALSDCTILLLTNDRHPSCRPEHTMVDGLIELEDELFDYRSERKLRIAKFRGSGFLRGRHSFRITDDGVVVFPRLEVAYATPTQPDRAMRERVSTGVPGLDAMLRGGLPRATTTGLIGPTGGGKTTLGLQFLGQCGPSEPGLLFGFYESPARLKEKAAQLGLNLGGLVEDGSVEIAWQAQTEILLDELGCRLIDLVQRRKVKRLFIDGIGGFIESSAQPERISRFFAVVVNQLRAMGVTTLYSMEMLQIIGSSLDLPVTGVSSLIENLLVMRFAEVEGETARVLSVTKIRDSGFDPALRSFEIGNGGIVVGEAFKGYEAAFSGFARERRGGVSRKAPKGG